MIVLKGATVFTEGALKKTDLGIEGDTIKKLGTGLTGETTDCSGMLILPGAIDIHVHFRDLREKHKEDWLSGTRAAAKGGVTTVFDMVNNNPPTTTPERLMHKKELAKEGLINYGLYYGLGPDNLDSLGEVAPLVCGFKLHMCRTTGDLLLTDPKLQQKSFEMVKKTGKIIAVHAEDQDIMDEAAEKNRDRTDFLSHADSRPKKAEIKAVEYALNCAKKSGARTHLTHVSTRESLNAIRAAKKSGVDLTCDTTPTYMFLSRKNLGKMGSYCKMNPPVRTEYDVSAVWKNTEDGTIDIISTDHAPHTIEEKEKDFRQAPAGVPSVEMRMPLLLDAVNRGRLKLETLVNTCSTNPAVRFGLKNRGEIRKGYYADLMVVNMDYEKEVKRSDQLTKCGWSPYEGMTLKGWPVKTFVNGRLVYSLGKFYYNEARDLFG